ncbi:serine hydrolase [Streptomyces sp. NBC_00316]|uniref:serine hydrolase n=1 Tax=Streptomyces sp. NBC_00316 TaxID=2975710 RepID=UPI002E28A1F5|nr:serine hydrolase [Streptomyces sp. NBC_00316]
MPRNSFAPLAVAFVRRHPSHYALAALALAMTGWAASGGLADPARADEPRTAPRSGAMAGPLPGIVQPRVVPALSSASATGAASPSVTETGLRTAGTGVAPDQILSRQLAPVVAATPASLSVAVLDPADGRAARYGVRAGTTYDTASIVKVDILAALLLQAQDQHRELTAQEKESASLMIRISDNASANALWRVIGEAPGLNAANRRLGLTGTTGGSDGHWGLTQTTATDQLALLTSVFGTDSPLDAASRTYLRSLMGGIEAGQDWGVSAAGPATGLKNGWLQRTATGRWDVNSIGLVRVDGHDRLVAVLSRGNVTMADGVTLVEKAAKAAVQALGTTA